LRGRVQGVVSMGLLVTSRVWTMELTSEGRLRRWLGPAIRGTLAWAVKEEVCLWPVDRRRTQHKTCRGCEHLQVCPYGVTFESELPPGRAAPSGMADGQRAITIRPPFPAPEYGWAGDRLGLCATFLGTHAAGTVRAIEEILTRPGRALALGSDRVGFRLAPHPAQEHAGGATQQIECADLPPSPRACAGRLPAVRVDLIAPLFLKEAARGTKARAVRAPSFAQLVRASLRTVGRAFAAFGDNSLERRVDFAALKAAAEQVATAMAWWEPFCQRHPATGAGRAMNWWG